MELRNLATSCFFGTFLHPQFMLCIVHRRVSDVKNSFEISALNHTPRSIFSIRRWKIPCSSLCTKCDPENVHHTTLYKEIGGSGRFCFPHLCFLYFLNRKLHGGNAGQRIFHFQISVEKLETNPRLSTFLKGVAERAKQHTRVPKPTMIIMVKLIYGKFLFLFIIIIFDTIFLLLFFFTSIDLSYFIHSVEKNCFYKSPFELSLQRSQPLHSFSNFYCHITHRLTSV